MKADMKTQIRGYVSQIEEDQAPIGAAEVLALVEPVRVLPRPAAPVPMDQTIVRRQVGLSWGYGAAALAVVLLLVGGAAWIARSSRQVEPVSGQHPVSSLAPFSADDALPVAEAYFDAYNAGDVDEVIALFTPDAWFSGNFGTQDRADWEQLLVWNAAQGTALSPPECKVVDEFLGESVKVSCPHGNLDALVLAHQACPVPINLTLTITPDGISEWVSFFGDPNFNVVGAPFLGWVLTHHPEDADTLRFASWTSRQEAEQSGLLTAQYAPEWAAWADANGFSYRDSC